MVGRLQTDRQMVGRLYTDGQTDRQMVGILQTDRQTDRWLEDYRQRETKRTTG